MSRLAYIALGLVLSSARAAAQDVVVRTSLEPHGSVVLGQQAQLFVDVLFPGAMPHPPRVAAPRVAGAQVFRFETQATNIAERVGGVAYVGQRFEFDIYPRRAGTLAVPPVRVTLLDRGGDPTGGRTGAALSLSAIVPAGLDPSGPVVAATSVTLRETWEPAAPGTLRVGDALARLVTRTAPGVPGLALAGLRFDAPDGVRAYADPPRVQDRVERGEVVGARTDRVTYVFARPGRFVLAAIAQPWWDLRAGAAHTLTLPARTVEIAGAPDERSEGARGWRVAGMTTGAVLLALGVGAFLARMVLRLQRGSRRSSAERIAFHALRDRCAGGDPIETYRAWQAWDAARAERGQMDAELAAAVRTLEACLFGRDASWTLSDAARLREAAQAARRPRRSRARRSALPPLNPGRAS